MPFINLDQANAFETAELPGQGDTNAGGGGWTTSAATNETDLRAFGLDSYTQSQSGTRISNGSGDGNTYDAVSGKHRSKHLAPAMAGNPAANHPYWTIGLFGAGLLGFIFIPKADTSDTKSVKVSVVNIAKVTLMGGFGIMLTKLFFGVWNVPSVSPTVETLL